MLSDLEKLPTEFTFDQSDVFFKFFDTWGDHVYESCQIGGWLTQNS